MSTKKLEIICLKQTFEISDNNKRDLMLQNYVTEIIRIHLKSKNQFQHI